MHWVNKVTYSQTFSFDFEALKNEIEQISKSDSYIPEPPIHSYSYTIQTDFGVIKKGQVMVVDQLFNPDPQILGKIDKAIFPSDRSKITTVVLVETNRLECEYNSQTKGTCFYYVLRYYDLSLRKLVSVTKLYGGDLGPPPTRRKRGVELEAEKISPDKIAEEINRRLK